MTEPIRLSRRGFLGATMAAAAPRASPSPNAEAFASAGAKTSPLVVHDWAYYQKDFTGFKAYFQKYGVPKYITFNTDQAELARAASGAITYDITHPCIAYIPGLAGRGPDRPDRHARSSTAWQQGQQGARQAGHRRRQDLRHPVGLGLLDADVPRRQVRALLAVVGGRAVRQEAARQGHDVRRGRRHDQDRRAHQRPPERQHADAEADRPVARHDDQGQGQHRLVLAVRDAGHAGLHLGQGLGHLRLAGHLRAGRREAVDEERQGRLHAAQGRAAGLDLLVRDRGQAEERGPGLRLPQHRLLGAGDGLPRQRVLHGRLGHDAGDRSPRPTRSSSSSSTSTRSTTALKPPKVWLEQHLENRNAYLKAYQQVKSA